MFISLVGEFCVQEIPPDSQNIFTVAKGGSVLKVYLTHFILLAQSKPDATLI